MFNSFRRIIALGWQNLTRDSGIAVANIFIIMIPIILTSALFMVKDVSNFLVKELQNKADISVYFNESVSEDDILRAKDKIAGVAGIESAVYVSKDEAMADFGQRHQDNAVLMESLQEVNGNPFLPVINVTAVSTGQYDQVAELLAGPDFKDMVNKINYSERKDVIEKIFSITSGTQKIGLLLFLILGVISIIVTFNTVRMAILSRGVEVGIQRLVGAGRWFIRGQFLVEGLIFGLLGAAFSLFVTAATCWYLNAPLAAILPGMNLWQNFMANLWTLFAIQLGIGAGLGTLSGMIAITRYLKV